MPSAPALPYNATSNDPPFKLKVDPENLVTFRSDDIFGHTYTVVKLTNTTPKRQIFKVKTTSNVMFRVRPPIAFLNPGESMNLKFGFVGKQIPDSSMPQFFVIWHMVTEDTQPAKDVWKPSMKAEGIRRINVQFLKADGSVWPPNTPAPPRPPKPVAAAPPNDFKWKPNVGGTSPAAANIGAPATVPPTILHAPARPTPPAASPKAGQNTPMPFGPGTAAPAPPK